MTYEEVPRVPAQYTGAADYAMPLEVRAVVGAGLSVPVAARLRYHSAEPYAVHLDNHVDLDTPVTWVFARELLAAGVSRSAGIGDVSVRPGEQAHPDSVLISLGDDEGRVVLRAQTSLVRIFLAHTERIVPFGSEHGHLDTDGLIRRLLDDRPPEPGP